MNYRETIAFLFSQLPMYQRQGAAAYKNNLDNTEALDRLFGHPHRKYKTIHVAGTNGKGSVSHMLASILQAAGYKTGLYTSPHLKDYRERIRVNGEMIPQDDVVRFVEDFRQKSSGLELEPSFFEFTVAMAFDYFARQEVDVAVVEVGLGGRLDSTNIITPGVSVITNISLDHTALLGETIEQIAVEKAGIIKEGVPVVIGEKQDGIAHIFESIAGEKSAELCYADEEYRADTLQVMNGRQVFNFSKNGVDAYPKLEIDLLGKYQEKNICTTLSVVNLLMEKGWRVTRDDVYNGLKDVCLNTGLTGRWQVLKDVPYVVCDTGHNEAGIRVLLEQVRCTPFKKLHIVLGVVNDKNIATILSLLPAEAVYYFTRARIPRALDEKELAQEAAGYNLHGENYADVMSAYKAALDNAERDDMIFIGGSTFVVAEVL